MSKPLKANKHWHLALNHIDVACASWGPPEGLTVLALHGWLDNMASFLPLIADGQWLYDHNIHLISMDWPGHGQSGHRSPGEAYLFMDYVVNLHEVVQLLSERPLVLLGHSLGGAISSIYAGSQVADLTGLILIESLGPMTGSVTEGPEQLAKHLHRRFRYRDANNIKVEPEVLISARCHHNQIDRSNAELLVMANLKQQGDHYVWRSDPRLRIPSPMYLSNDQVDAFIANISCPTQIIYAQDGPFNDFPRLGERLKLIAVQDLVGLEGGHHLHMQNPLLVRESICRFINKIR